MMFSLKKVMWFDHIHLNSLPFLLSHPLRPSFSLLVVTPLDWELLGQDISFILRDYSVIQIKVWLKIHVDIHLFMITYYSLA